MTSHYSPLYNYESASRYPYVGNVSVGEKDRVNFIYQFVKSSDFIYTKNTKDDLTGPHNTFPNYGDLPETSVMRNYGFDISISPWQSRSDLAELQDIWLNPYFDILFQEAVYPIKVIIHEICNPGCITQILAQDSDEQWFTLWKGLCQIGILGPKLFSPPLQSHNFKTKKLRLKFSYSNWPYYTKIDTVMLIGTSELILRKNPKESLTDLLKRINCTYPHQEDIYNFITADYKNPHLDIDHLQNNFSEYCIIDKSNVGKSNVQPTGQRYSYHLLFRNSKNVKPMKHSSDKPEKLSRCILSVLSDEIKLEILKYLDLTTLCRMSQINKSFNNLTRDRVFYTRLNMRYICGMNTTYIKNIFDYFILRCKYLRQLDLTRSNFDILDFERFLDNCGSHLTHIRLSRCTCINNDALLKISKICKNLKELDLTYCERIDDEGFSYLGNLEGLEHLSLSYTRIKAGPLNKILQKNQRMRELYLEGTELGKNAIELINSSRDLEIINLAVAKNVSSQSIDAFADCKNLRIVKLGYTFLSKINDEDSFCRLLSSCQRLEEIHLTDTALTNRTLKSLTQCTNLKHLFLYCVRFVTSDKYSVIFEQCPKLQNLHLIYCSINFLLINQWKERYPYVSIHTKLVFYTSLF